MQQSFPYSVSEALCIPIPEYRRRNTEYRKSKTPDASMQQSFPYSVSEALRIQDPEYRVGRKSAITMYTSCIDVPCAPPTPGPTINPDRDWRSATGARWQCVPIHHRAGACVIVANGTIDV